MKFNIDDPLIILKSKIKIYRRMNFSEFFVNFKYRFLGFSIEIIPRIQF